MLIDEILKGISNDLVISGHMVGNSPLKDLIIKHNKLAELDDSITVITERNTGAELKAALHKHNIETLIELLCGYVKAKKLIMLKDSNEFKYIEDRRNTIVSENNLGRRITDSTEPNNVPDNKETPISEINKNIINNIFIFFIVFSVIVILMILWNTSSGDTNQETNKNILEALISIIKIIFN